MARTGLSLLLLAVSASGSCCVDCSNRSNVTVPSDCSTIQAGVDCADDTVFVSKGTYREQVTVTKPGISIVGQSSTANDIVLTWSVPNAAVLNVSASNFLLANVTIYNDAENFSIGKNFALYVSEGDRTSVYYSSFFGAQDTIYTGQQRVFFYGSVINGSSDFLYGQGSAVWENCTLIGEPGSRGWSFITAHAGENVSNSINAVEGNRSAYLIKDCRIPRPEGARLGATWLGRPWGLQAAVIYDSVWMDAHIAATGWNPWYTKCKATGIACADIYFAEHSSSGPGANASGRVHWAHQLDAAQVQEWSVARVLRGWEPPSPQLHWKR